jgi:hypothetical protein
MHWKCVLPTCRKPIKKSWFSFYFTYISVNGPQPPTSEFLELCLDVAILETSYDTHAMLAPHYTKNVSLPTTSSSHATPTFVEAIRVCRLASSFPVCHSRRLFKNLCMKFPHPRQGNNKLSYRVSSLVIWFVNFDANTFVFLEYVLSEKTLPLNKTITWSTSRFSEGL